MKIAILGSVSSVIPPHGQAAIEKLAYQQALGLARAGHTILLFALKGSTCVHPNIRLVEVGDGETRSGKGNEDLKPEEMYGASYKLRLELVNLAHVIQKLDTEKDEFDIVLNNLRGEAVVLPLLHQLHKPLFHVLHLPIFPELADLFKLYQTSLISISNAQRNAFPSLNYAGTVYNGVDTDAFNFSPSPGNYVLYLGSIGPNKNPKDAILAARKSKEKLIIGGRIKDQGYFDTEIKPLIDGTSVEWIGEKTEQKIVMLYRGAKAFLFPTLWDEPFGLVAIEALSCGTPVIAYPHGALPEIIEDGKNGYLVRDVAEMAEKIKQISQIDRGYCRQTVIEHFSIEKMIEGYERVLIS